MVGRRKDTQTHTAKASNIYYLSFNFLLPTFCLRPNFSAKFSAQLLPPKFSSYFSFATTNLLSPSFILSALLCRAIPAIIPGLPGETRLPSLNWKGVKKLICCLILKLPSPVSGPDPVRAMVNFNHGLKLEWDNCARVVYT